MHVIRSIYHLLLAYTSENVHTNSTMMRGQCRLITLAALPVPRIAFVPLPIAASVAARWLLQPRPAHRVELLGSSSPASGTPSRLHGRQRLPAQARPSLHVRDALRRRIRRLLSRPPVHRFASVRPVARLRRLRLSGALPDVAPSS